MARQLRIEYPGAVYHVTSRGNAGLPIFADDGDRAAFLKVLQAVVSRFRWRCHAYCLMGNHYHLLIETPEPNLSRGMRQLNGVYTQAYNRRHEQAGHVMQGRFKAILVEKESYLLQLCRYIVRNPVAARLTKKVEDWPWSSFQATAGLVEAPEWLEIDWILGQFGETGEAAQAHYRQFVAAAPKDDHPWDELTGRIFLGGGDFTRKLMNLMDDQRTPTEIPREQRFAARPPLADLLAGEDKRGERDRRIRQAHVDFSYSLKEIGEVLGIHYATVSRAVKRAETKVSESKM
ncbi:REP-associated tyrosine transposase [Trichloromonas sp.]|uniref:REP-associated tyrosine transposase n=1 Tax=Trichloromonas sp. TaxID=3069249 RepID=UPI002A49D01F|nr:transposase [Trichloromonas sp.]